MSTMSAGAARWVRRSVVGLTAVAVMVLPGSPAEAATTLGRFHTLPAGTELGLKVDGLAVLTRNDYGTSGRVVVVGLKPNVTYAAHLHKEPCSASNPGGGHYMDVVGAGAAPPNELWFSSNADPTAGIRANRAGITVGKGSATWVARPEARAVIIHVIPPGGNTGGGPKIACADL